MSRGRLAAMAITGLVTLGLAAAYFVHARATSSATVTAATSEAATGPAPDPAAILAGPHVVFRDGTPGTSLGRLSVTPLTGPDGPRANFALSCERSYATQRAAVCVTARRGLVPSYRVSTLDASMRVVGSTQLNGIPSRARMSRDGSLVATTTFVTGHAYGQPGFSTETIIRRSGKSFGQLETWRATADGHPFTSPNRNFWGVTFGTDDETFYVTGASGPTTWLMRGSIARRTLTALRPDAECPSLSPDGKLVVYKKRLGNSKPGIWRLAALNLGSGQETLLAETHSVDDQVEWLDDDSILYALPRASQGATTSDVWVVAADGTGSPHLFISQASSPAVVR